MFWQNQVLTDVLYLLAFGAWAAGVLLLLLVPGLMGVIWSAYKYKRSEAVSVYIARFVPYALFGQLMTLVRCLMLALVIFSWAWHLGYQPEHLPLSEHLVYILYIVGLLWGLNLLRSWIFAYWAYVFMPRERSSLLAQDFLVISIVLTLLLAPVSLLALVPAYRDLAMWLCLGLVSLSIVLRSLQTLRRLLSLRDGYIYVFLYLCTHEWLPWCCIAWAVRYAYMG